MNYWLKQYHLKYNRRWTVEFFNNGFLTLPARTVGLPDPDCLNQSNGIIAIVFHDGLINTKDHELIVFLASSKASMKGSLARIHVHSGPLSNIEYYEIKDLDFHDIDSVSAARISDLKFEFSFRKIIHFKM